jgi:hypothetical protein
MDDPALRKFLGISGHASNIFCPLCLRESRLPGADQNFGWPDVTVEELEIQTRSDSHYRSGMRFYLEVRRSIALALIVEGYRAFEEKLLQATSQEQCHDYAMKHGYRFGHRMS